MVIELTTQPAPTIEPHIQADIAAMWPRVFMQWNPRHAVRKRDERGKKVWDARWEIWVELTDVSHPDAKHWYSDNDVWNTDEQCWMRYLQVYETEAGGFAPADERLVIGLEMADTWKNRRFYDEHIEVPHEIQEFRQLDEVRQVTQASSEYYRTLDRTLVAPGGRGGDWRWRIR
jgi:hypothetical protein